MRDVEVKDGFYIITIPKAILVLSRDQFVDALRRGKWWKRKAARQAQEAAAAKVQVRRRLI